MASSNFVKLYNPEQGVYSRTYDFKNIKYIFFKGSGCLFADNEQNKEVIKHFLDMGFVKEKFVRGKKEDKIVKKETIKEEPKPKKKIREDDKSEELKAKREALERKMERIGKEVGNKFGIKKNFPKISPRLFRR